MRGEQALWFLGLAVVFAALEAWLRLRSGRSYDRQALYGTLGVGLGQLVFNGLSGIAIGAVYLAFYQATPLRVPLDQAWSWGLLFLLSEFLYYWQHRLSHEVRWLWATHSVHHSAEELTLPAAFRLGWTGSISGLWLFFLLLPLLGWHPAAVAGILALNLRFQYFLHSELPPWLGPLEWVRGGSRNLNSGDKWIADLTAAMLAAKRKQDEQATPPEPQSGIQGQGGAGCCEG